MRRLLKRTLEVGLVRSGLTNLWPRISGGNVVVLGYHNIVPGGDAPRGDSSLHLTLPNFQAQLDLLNRTHTIVPLAELLTGREGLSGPLASITFDDAYRGTLELGVGELVGRGLSSTVFVSPGLLGSEGFWWDLVADPSRGSVPDEFRRHALGALGGRTDRSSSEPKPWASWGDPSRTFIVPHRKLKWRKWRVSHWCLWDPTHGAT